MDDDVTGLAEVVESIGDERRVLTVLALGQIAENAAIMEVSLRGIVGALIGSSRATVVVSGQSVRWLCDIAIAIVDHNDDLRAKSLGTPAAIERFKNTIKRCSDLNVLRNNALHGAPITGSDVRIVSKLRKPHIFAVDVPLKQLQALATDLSVATAALLDAAMKVEGID